MMASKRKWIKGAIKHPGALHRALGVPEGEKIPADKMAAARNSRNPRVRKMAALAGTLGKLGKGGGETKSRGERWYGK
jgi:hypothetical protein